MRNIYSCLRIGISGEWIDFLGSIKLGKLLDELSGHHRNIAASRSAILKQ